MGDGGGEAVCDAQTLTHADQRGHDAVEAASGVPDPFGELGILKERVRPRGVKGGHAHVHAPKRKHPPKPFRPKVLGRAGVDALKGVEGQHLEDKGETQHGQERGEILLENVGDAELVVAMRLLQKGEIPFKPILALPLLHLPLHLRLVGR